jgi:hypothetical protein
MQFSDKIGSRYQRRSRFAISHRLKRAQITDNLSVFDLYQGISLPHIALSSHETANSEPPGGD